MNIRELRQAIHDLPDDMEVEAAMDGDLFVVGHTQAVKEWNVFYLGRDKDDLVESFLANAAEEEYEDSGDIDAPGDDDEWPEDRQAFQESLAKTEDVDNILAWANMDCAGEVCAVSPPKTKPLEDGTEMM